MVFNRNPNSVGLPFHWSIETDIQFYARVHFSSARLPPPLFISKFVCICVWVVYSLRPPTFLSRFTSSLYCYCVYGSYSIHSSMGFEFTAVSYWQSGPLLSLGFLSQDTWHLKSNQVGQIIFQHLLLILLYPPLLLSLLLLYLAAMMSLCFTVRINIDIKTSYWLTKPSLFIVMLAWSLIWQISFSNRVDDDDDDDEGTGYDHYSTCQIKLIFL